MYELIEHRVLSSNISSIVFSNIPQNADDLFLKINVRTTKNSANDDILIAANSGGTYTFNQMYSLQSAISGSGGTITAPIPGFYSGTVPASQATSNTFSTQELYISNYSTTGKIASFANSFSPNNISSSVQNMVVTQWSGGSAITSLSINSESSSNFVAGSSVTLYKVNRTSPIGLGQVPLALGGYINYDNGYWYHTFTGSGTFTPLTSLNVDYLVIGGGGGGGAWTGGGGGAGGYRDSSQSQLPVTANTSYAITVGAGGPGGTQAAPTSSGSNSTFSTITSIGGGSGGSYTGSYIAPAIGGSGGGGNGLPGAAGTVNQGYAGGNGGLQSVNYNAGGGGGSNGSGNNATTTGGGNGGFGRSSAITGISIIRAGGGGGGANGASYAPGSGMAGGGNGSNSSGTVGGSATPNSGSGGGGGGWNTGTGSNGGAGGSGIVIIRYKG